MADEHIVKIEDPIYIQAVSSVDPLLVYLRGYSAYEVAVQAGFEGTREEWLASLAEEATLICEGYRDEAEGFRNEAQTARDELDPVLINIATLLAIGAKLTEIDTVSDNIDAILSVNNDLILGLSSKIGIVAGSIANVNLVGDSIANVNAVAGKLTEVETVSGDLTNIDTVAAEISDVGTVANNIADVNLAADNIVAIQAAPTYAEAAEKWAENPEDSPVETGQYSALHHSAKASAAQTAAEAARDEAYEVVENKIDTVDADEKMFKTLRTGATGLVTLSPTTQYFTYRLDILGNTTLNIDLQRMINQVGNARCRLIIDMPIIRTITITNPILWGGTPQTFAEAGQYIFEVIDVGGANTPLLWQVAATTKAQTTGNILYVDSTGADYTVGQINGETASRTTSTWSEPFKYLQNAINASEAGDIILVKAGVHKPTHLRTSPTVYTDGDHLLRDATFSPKDSVDMYGGFVGTESKTWERVMDEDGYPVNPSILCGDIKGEAEIDPLKTAGDTRTDLSKANAAYNVFMAQDRVTNITYCNGFEVRYGNADGDIANYTNSGGGINARSSLLIGINNKVYSNTATNLGGGWFSGTNTNCTAYSNTASSGGGWSYGTNTNCTAYSNTSTTNGGGWRDGTNTNCTAYSNTATNGGGWSYGTNTNCTAYSNTSTTNGGGWRDGTNTNCTAYSNTATNGGGWRDGTNTNCTAYSNTSTTNGGGWRDGTNTNCTAYSNTAATNGGGWFSGTNTNCTAYSNTASAGGGWRIGTNTNCTGINNKGPEAVYGSTVSDAHINCILLNNRNVSNTIVGFDNSAATGVKIFRNNAYDTNHPIITGGTGSDIDTTTCIPNATLEQIKIEVPTVIGQATTETELQELHEYRENILTKLRPKEGSVLKGAGVNNTTYPNTTDFEGAERPENSTIGILEGE